MSSKLLQLRNTQNKKLFDKTWKVHKTFEELISSVFVKFNIQKMSSKKWKFRQEDYLKMSDYYIIKKIIKNIPS